MLLIVLGRLLGDGTLVIEDELRLHVDADMGPDEVSDLQRFGIFAQFRQSTAHGIPFGDSLAI